MRTITLHVAEEKYQKVVDPLAEMGIEVEPEIEIPQWQMDMVHERMAEYKANPSITIPWDDVKDKFDLDAQ